MSVWHEGERELQARAGARERLELVGAKIVRPAMPDPHRELFEKLPFVLVARVDAGGVPRVGIAYGAPGFVHTPDARTFALAPERTVGTVGQLEVGTPVGLLGIELSTRRRNRANGRVVASEGARAAIEVTQSFGNCPKYIQVRRLRRTPRATSGAPRTGWDERARAIVQAADTFFVASAARPDPDAATADGVDVSHRGGRPGFVLVEGATLRWPDYPGNNFFNTLGNLVRHPHASLLFVDFPTGDVLTLAGRATVAWDDDEVRFDVDEARLDPGAFPFTASAPELAPELDP